MATGTVLQFTTHPGQRDAFVEAFKRAKVLEAASQVEGFRSAQLLVPSDPEANHVVVTARWDDEAAYGRWLAHPDREKINAALLQFVTETPAGSMYTVADERQIV
jgi:heme-degrading monooxygenase HmoA